MSLLGKAVGGAVVVAVAAVLVTAIHHHPATQTAQDTNTGAGISATHNTGGMGVVNTLSTAMAGDTGAGTGVWPVCSHTPAQPGQQITLTNGGIDSRGIEVTNPGHSTETLTVTATAVQRGQALYGRGMAVPPSWVHVTGNPVTLAASGDTWRNVTVDVPAGAQHGTYVADLTVSSGTGHNVASVSTYLAFTVGITRPAWPAAVLGLTDPCWAPAPGQYESWQQWSRTTSQPPGWHWTTQKPAPSAWTYQAPPGWTYSWADPNNPGWAYHGPAAHPCLTTTQINASGWGSGGPGGGPWIGGDYPDTSTAVGCAAWLHGAKT